MAVVGVAMIVAGVLYFIQDTPSGDSNIRARKRLRALQELAAFKALKDKSVWSLAVLYGACLGMN